MTKHEWYVANKAKCIARTLQWRKDNPDGRRKHRRTARGIKNATGETKTGPCEICLRIMKLQQDHDHVTGLVRGWLCNRCNVALGWLEAIQTIGLIQAFQAYRDRFAILLDTTPESVVELS